MRNQDLTSNIRTKSIPSVSIIRKLQGFLRALCQELGTDLSVCVCVCVCVISQYQMDQISSKVILGIV